MAETFGIIKSTGDVILPYDAAGEPLSPVEAETGVPLPIYQTSFRGAEFCRVNGHHANFEEADYLGTLGRRAVRFTRIQRGSRALHRRFHGFYAGTAFPETSEDEFRLTILGDVGYVPPYAVDVSGPKPEIRVLTEAERAALQAPGIFVIERKRGLQAEIGQFIMHYAIWKGLDARGGSTLDEFVAIRRRDARRDPELRQRKMELGMQLLELSLERVVDPVEPFYERARRQQALKVGAASCALAAVRDYVGDYMADYLRLLEYRVRLNYRAGHVALQTGVVGI